MALRARIHIRDDIDMRASQTEIALKSVRLWERVEREGEE